MSILTTSQEPVPSAAPIDHGLRSVQGIRWLLLAGGLVVAVSVIRLVAAEWGILIPAARFLTLVAGALAVFGAGDVTRRRLCLPVAGSALLFLGMALVPLLAWGAAYLELLSARLGWLSLVIGLGALLAIADHTLRGVLAYRGGAYTVASGIFLVALPVLPYLEARYLESGWSGSPKIFFLVAAAVLGLLLRGACRHINRFFFHRDRLSGVERPVHWLPFAMLVLLYGAGMSLLAAFSTHLAVPLVFVAIALIDAGEEYYRALIRATAEEGEEKRSRWPRRSLALLALGFAALAAAPAVAMLDTGRHSLAVVASIAALRLLTWARRYSNTAAHACGLLAAIVAYHAFPVLVPEVVRNLFLLAVHSLGVDSGGPGALSLGDLGMLAALLALAWSLGHRLTPAMRRAHAVITAGCASLMLLVSLLDPAASRLVAPAIATLLAAGIFILRWRALIPIFYQALATSALAWAWSPALSGALISARTALYLGAAHLFFLGAGLVAARRREPAVSASVIRLLAWPPVAVAFALLLRALVLAESHWAIAGILTLVAAKTLLLSALLLRRTWLFAIASLAVVCGAHCLAMHCLAMHRLAVSANGEATAILSMVSQGLMAAFWLLAWGCEGRGEALGKSLRQAAHLGSVVCAELGLLWPVAALIGGSGAGVEAFHLALLAGMLIADELRAAKRSSLTATDGAEYWPTWRLEAAMVLLFVWVPAQVFGLASGSVLTLIAAAWLTLAVALFATAGLLARHRRAGSSGERIARLAPSFLSTAMISATMAGIAAILATLDTAGSPWLPILPGFLASALFVFIAVDRRAVTRSYNKPSSFLATGYFAACGATLLSRLDSWGPELHCLGPGLALLGLSGLLRHELDRGWRRRLFTAGATLLYAMPVLGLLEELSWGWQIVLLLLSVAFGAASFRLRSRSLLLVSSIAMIVDLACFLIKLRQTAPLLVWVAGIVFGLSLMAAAALLEHRREMLLQRIRIWGRELRAWA